jgi:hypothetical protein
MPRSPTAWKALELLAAQTIGGIRIHRGGDFSESLPDVIAPTDYLFKSRPEEHAIVIECKYRASQPWIDLYKKLQKKEDNKIYLQTEEPGASFIFLPLEEFKANNLFNLTKVHTNRVVPDYIRNAVRQSREYINDLDIRDSIQLLYYKATKDRKRPPFSTFSSIAVIGQKHDKLRLACFHRLEFESLL